MKNTRKILLALLLVFTLLASIATVTAFAEEGGADDSTTVYFENNWLWTDVCCYYWGDGVTSPEWPGTAMTNVGTLSGHELYSFDLPTGVTSVIINGIKDDGSGNRDQTPDITSGIVDGAAWRMLWVDGNQVESFTYDPENPGASTPTPTPGGSGTIYTVAGVAGLCYSEWSTTDTYNDMTYNEETGLYEKTFTGIPAGSYECKVVANHSWDQAWGGDYGEFGNYGFEIYEEQNVTITFNEATGTVGHTLAPSTGADENRPAPEAPDIDYENTITIYLGNSANWETPFVYYWTLGSSDQNANWPGEEMEWDSEKLLYYVEVPTYYVNIIFNNGNGVQTADLAIPGDGALFDNVTNEWSDISNYTPPVPPENTSEDVTVTVKDDAGWGEVYIYYWDADGAEAMVWPGTPMDMDENGNYVATIPAGYYCVIFNNGGSWEDGSLLQTPDLVIPTNGKTFISNGDSVLYDDGTANDNDAWKSVGGNNNPDDDKNDNNKPNDGDNTNTPSDDGEQQAPAKMTFMQKIAKALLLFIRKMQDFFGGIFKKK